MPKLDPLVCRSYRRSAPGSELLLAPSLPIGPSSHYPNSGNAICIYGRPKTSALRFRNRKSQLPTGLSEVIERLTHNTGRSKSVGYNQSARRAKIRRPPWRTVRANARCCPLSFRLFAEGL